MPVALITGAGGGLGGATAELFASRGWTVLAADLRPPPAAPAVVPVELDVTDPDSCRRAADQAAAAVGGVDVVVNFAGVLQVGTPLVELEPEKMRSTLEVNLFGTYLVNRTFFPLVRARRGRIVNISSEAGRFKALAFSGPYSVSKHAVEAYSDVLRRELVFAGVDVVVVQPGAFRTNMTRDINTLFAEARVEGSPFAAQVAKVSRSVRGRDQAARDPRLLAEVVWTAATTPRPRRRYRAHHDRRSAVLDRLPDGLIDRLMRRALA